MSTARSARAEKNILTSQRASSGLRTRKPAKPDPLPLPLFEYQHPHRYICLLERKVISRADMLPGSTENAERQVPFYMA